MKNYVSSYEIVKNQDTLYVTQDYDWAMAPNSKELIVYVYDENRLDVTVPVTAWEKDEEFWRLAEKGDLLHYMMHKDSSAKHSVVRFVFEEEYELE